jgi:hypothetical protein
MNPEMVANICGPVATVMYDAAVTRRASGDLEYNGYLLNGFRVVASRLDHRQARQIAKKLTDRISLETDSAGRNSLTSTLVVVAERMDPLEAGEILVAALVRETNPRRCETLSSAIAALTGRLDKLRSQTVCSHAVGALLRALERATDAVAKGGVEQQSQAHDCSTLANAFSTVASRMETTRAHRESAGAAGLLARALIQSKANDAREALATAIRTVADTIEPTRASEFLAATLERETEPRARVSLAQALSSAAARMNVEQASEICASVARALVAKLGRDSSAEDIRSLADALFSVTYWVEPMEASQLCDHVVRLALETRTRGERDRRTRTDLDETVFTLLPRLTHERATELAMLMFAEPDLNDSLDTATSTITGSITGTGSMAVGIGSQVRRSTPQVNGLSAALTEASSAEVVRRIPTMTMATIPGVPGPPVSPAMIAAVRIASEPFPCRLSTQELVELLKMPTCFGPARRVVLDHLGNRYGQRFINHWAFVRYAKEHDLDLDFTTPPKRPDAITRSVGG